MKKIRETEEARKIDETKQEKEAQEKAKQDRAQRVQKTVHESVDASTKIKLTTEEHEELEEYKKIRRM